MAWKEIQGFEKYSINERGEVKNTQTGYIYSQQIHKGSAYVRLSNATKAQNFRVQGLVEKHFPTELNGEEWRSITGYENYEISNKGRVKNVSKGTVMKGNLSDEGYARVELTDGETRKTLFVHQLVAKAFIPNPDNMPYPDHINNIRNDNRVENLRWSNEKTNNMNRLPMKNTSSRYKGVSLKKSRVWYATIRNIHIGCFQNEEDAARAYDERAREMFGEFALLNFP